MAKGKLKEKKLLFVIAPTPYGDYDILALGHRDLLEKFAGKDKYYHLIKNSKIYGIDILILDTCETLSGAKSCIKEYRELYNDCCKSIH